MCKTGKVRYRSRGGAASALKRIKNAALESYRCNVCGGWHLGHSNQDWCIQQRIDQLLGKL
jgi:hypothetical protein